MNTPTNPVDDERLEKALVNLVQTTVDSLAGKGKYQIMPEYVQEAKAKLLAWHSQGVGEAVKLVEDKFEKLEHGIFAVLPLLDKPYPDDPRWTPYERFIHPREIMVREALKGNDVGELWAMGRAAEYKEIRKGSQ